MLGAGIAPDQPLMEAGLDSIGGHSAAHNIMSRGVYMWCMSAVDDVTTVLTHTCMLHAMRQDSASLSMFHFYVNGVAVVCSTA